MTVKFIVGFLRGTSEIFTIYPRVEEYLGFKEYAFIGNSLCVYDTLQENLQKSLQSIWNKIRMVAGCVGQKAIPIHQMGCVPGQVVNRQLVLPIVIIRQILPPTRSPLRPVPSEDSSEHAQDQGHLQEDQEPEVDAAEQGPVGDMVTGGEHVLKEMPWYPPLSFCPCVNVLGPQQSTQISGPCGSMAGTVLSTDHFCDPQANNFP